MSTSTASERVEITPEGDGITAEWLDNLVRHADALEAEGYGAVRIPIDDTRALVGRIRSDAERIRELESALRGTVRHFREVRRGLAGAGMSTEAKQETIPQQQREPNWDRVCRRCGAWGSEHSLLFNRQDGSLGSLCLRTRCAAFLP